MAFIESIKNYRISLSNIDAGVYEDLSFRMARYEGEEISQVFQRLISFLHAFRPGAGLINRDGSWFVETPLLSSYYEKIAVIGLPDWKLLDLELKRCSLGREGHSKTFSLYLTLSQDYETLLHRIKSRRIGFLEALNVYTTKTSEEEPEQSKLVDANSWNVVIIDDSIVQLEANSKTSSIQLSASVEKRDIWRDYQDLLQGL